ncbi:MAG: hypothetical protein A2V85_02515 [Chloroflexi bacterium RBG_16_72_14]|nr:MAG: hypothetical protein A2V85_02515 [Chloroflexi bacterium RBG_16_72_14]
MGEGFGLGDGQYDLSGTPGLADSRASDARQTHRDRLSIGRWPSAGTVVRVWLLAFLAIVVIAWTLTAITG